MKKLNKIMQNIDHDIIEIKKRKAIHFVSINDINT